MHFAGLKSPVELLAAPGGLSRRERRRQPERCSRRSAARRAAAWSSPRAPRSTARPSACRWTRTHPLRPATPYGATKLAVERLLAAAAAADPAWSVAILRYFNPVGAHASGAHRRAPRRHADQPDAADRRGRGRPAGGARGLRRRLRHPRRHRRCATTCMSPTWPARISRRWTGPGGSAARRSSTSGPAPASRCASWSRPSRRSSGRPVPLRVGAAPRRRRRRLLRRPVAGARASSAGGRSAAWSRDVRLGLGLGGGEPRRLGRGAERAAAHGRSPREAYRLPRGIR